MEIVVPADGGDPRRGALHPTVRVELEAALAELDARRGPLTEAGQELLAAIDRRTPEDGRLRHLEPPAAARRAGDLILDGEPAAVEVEPPGALEAEPVGGRLGVAAALLDQLHGRARRQGIGGELPPLGGELGLLRVDGGHALDRHEPQVGPRVEDPDLLGVPGALAGGQRERARGSLVPGGELETPRSRADLDAQAAVGLEAARQRAHERERDEAVGQRPPEQHLAARPCDLELDARHELQRDVVDHPPVDDDVEPALLRRCDRAPLEPELALRVAVREGDGLAVEREAHETGLGGDRQQLGEAVPLERPAHRVRTPLEPDARHAAPEGHGRRLAVGPHVERRARRVSRKRNPSRALHEPVLGEAAGSAVEVERQARGPGALAMIRRALEERAERLLVAVHHPVGPRPKRLGDLLSRDRLGRRREDRQPPHHHRRHETPHRLTPPTTIYVPLDKASNRRARFLSTAARPVELGERREPGHPIDPTTQRAAT